MATSVDERAVDTVVRPFTIETSEAELEDLRARISATRWPEKETVPDQSQGPQLATMQALARHWRIGRAWVELMRRLGYTRFVAQGGDWAAVVTELMAGDPPPELVGIQRNRVWR